MNKSISFKLSSTNIFCSVFPPFFFFLSAMYTSLMRKYTDSSHKINQVHKGDLQSLDETGDEDKHVRPIKRDRCPETELRQKCSSFFNLRDSRSGDGPKRELKEVSSL